MDEKWLAVAGLVACIGVWIGMALGPVRVQRLRLRGRLLWVALRQRLRSPGQARQAQRQAEEAIERARRQPKVDREGNVFRPDRFGERRNDRDKLH